MTVGVGCDVVEHRLGEKLNWLNDIALLQRIFSIEEMSVFENRKTISFLSGRFAAKEAVLKCLGTGMQDDIALNQIQILSSNFGKPNITLNGHVKMIADKLGINSWHLSITHSEHYSIAFVIANA